MNMLLEQLLNKTIRISRVCLIVLGADLLMGQGGLVPTPTEALLKVKVVDMQGKPRKYDKVIFEDSASKKVYAGITGEDGTFSILVPKGKSYFVKLKSFESDTPQSVLRIPDREGLLTFEYTIKYELPKIYRLEHVYFDFGKATLKPSSYKALDNLVELLKLKKTMVIEVAGHTDDIGSYESNMELSRRRAEAVRSYLISKGIEPERVIAKGYGSTQPVAPNDSDENRQKNRRVEIRIIHE